MQHRRKGIVKTSGCYEIPLMTHNLFFIDNQQIGCILGKDFIIQHNITIDAAKRSLQFGTQPLKLNAIEHILTNPKPSHLPANSELSRKVQVISFCLPHQVKLIDPNRITSINQHRLPHHLKEVAIDHVKKLLDAGVIR